MATKTFEQDGVIYTYNTDLVSTSKLVPGQLYFQENPGTEHYVRVIVETPFSYKQCAIEKAEKRPIHFSLETGLNDNSVKWHEIESQYLNK